MARVLTPRQRAFVDAYLRHPVGAHAAQEAGYGRPYNRSAHQARKSRAVESATGSGMATHETEFRAWLREQNDRGLLEATKEAERIGRQGGGERKSTISRNDQSECGRNGRLLFTC